MEKCIKCDGTGWAPERPQPCNVCGLPCTFSRDSANYGLINARVAGGYYSTPGNGFGALDDCTEYRFSMCEFCLDWLFTQFRLPPKASSCVGGEEETFRPAAQRVAEDKWRTSKDEFYRYSEERRKAREQGQRGRSGT